MAVASRSSPRSADGIASVVSSQCRWRSRPAFSTSRSVGIYRAPGSQRLRRVNHQMPDFPATIGPLCDPEDKGPNLSFQGRDRRPRSRSWLHLDLYTAW